MASEKDCNQKTFTNKRKLFLCKLNNLHTSYGIKEKKFQEILCVKLTETGLN